jgi:hypothetical protein
VGATLDETRVELEAQRTRVRGTAVGLESAARRSLDIRAMVGRHPARTIGLAAGAAFFLLGGPHRAVRAVRRALGASADGQKAYAALPPALRAFVDTSASGFGASKAEAKGEMALALLAWRENPKNRKKADRLIAETLTPPGPSRAFWALVEVAGVTAAGIIAKQVVARSLAGGAMGALLGRPAPTATPVSGTQVGAEDRSDGAAKAAVGPDVKADSRGAPTKKSASYTGWSGRSVETTPKPSRKAIAPPTDGR